MGLGLGPSLAGPNLGNSHPTGSGFKREMDRQTDRQTDRQRDWQRDRQTGRQIDRRRYIQMER
jgi:Ni/Co efflux regulator RcnB